MLTNDIVKLTRDRIAELVRSREAPESDYTGNERRRAPRWPFPGAIGLRPADGGGDETWFGTCRDVSITGVGITCERYFEPGTALEIALHLPEATFCGKAVVRYCVELEADTEDEYAMGLEFDFDE